MHTPKTALAFKIGSSYVRNQLIGILTAMHIDMRTLGYWLVYDQAMNFGTVTLFELAYNSFSIRIGWMFLAAVMFLAVGCQSDATNPWTTERYRDPSEYRQVPHSTYAPTPTILPSIDGTSTSKPAEPGGDDELEQVLNDLGIQ